MGAFGFGPELAVGRAPGAAAAAPVPAFDFTNAVLPAGATLTRASPGGRWNAAGLWVSEAADTARFDHDPVSHALRGLLIEPQRTNAVLQSSAFEQGSWIKNGSGVAIPAVTADAAAAPDGTATAERIDYPAFDSGTAATFSLIQQAVTVAAPRCLSIWLRGGAGGEKIELCAFASGAYELTSPAALTLTTSWQRYSLVSTAAAASITLHLGLNAYNGIALAQGAATIFAWGAQVEAGTSATSTIATAGASATRAADALVLDWGSRGIADGAITVRYTFDDLTTQDVAATVAGGTASVPVTLNRARIRRAEKV